jgi:Tetratricopeptide repeat
VRRALAIDEASYGPDHPAVAKDLTNLALLLRDTNRFAEAEPLVRRALAIGEASYGPDHPAVGVVLMFLVRETHGAAVTRHLALSYFLASSAAMLGFLARVGWSCRNAGAMPTVPYFPNPWTSRKLSIAPPQYGWRANKVAPLAKRRIEIMLE